MAGFRRSLTTSTTRVVQLLAAVTLIAGSLWYWSPQPASSAPGDGFEITDANIVDSPAGAPYDWSALFDANGASTGVPGFVATSFVADPLSGDPLASPPCLPGKKGDPTVFTSGGSDKNGDPINSWTYESGSVPNSKDDLSNLYAAARQEPNANTGGNDTVIYFGLERSDSSGSAHMDFEFLQNPIGLQATGTDSSGCPSGHFVGTRTVGDLLLVMDFDNGGTVGNPQVLRWDGTTYVPATGLPAGTTGLFENTAGPIAAGPWGARNAQGNPVTSIPQNGFVEGFLNVSGLARALGTTTPACYSSFDAKTRSSSSWSSELKDFALGAFDTCDARISITPSGVNEVGSNHTFTAHVDANATGTFTPKSGVLVTGTISGVGSFVGGNTCTTDATGNCTLTITSATAGTSTVDVSATVEVIPGHSVFRSTATNPGSGGSGPATKNWVDAYVKVTPNDVNAVNDPHTFTVEYGVLTGGATGLTIDTPTITPAVTPSGYTGYSDTCASPTQVVGQNVWQCTVTINSTVATVYTANASATTTVHMTGGTPASVALPRSTSGTAGPGGNTGATKTYVDARISISPNGLNQVDDPTTPAIEDAHTITATVETKDGNGAWVKAPAGTPVTFSLSGVGSFVGGTSSCNTTGTTGQCTVQINSLVYGTSSVSASTSLTVHGVALTRATNTAVNTAAGGSGDVTKKWVDASITVVQTAVNEVNHEHTFTIAVTPLVPADASVTNVAITPSVDPATTVVGTTCGSNVALVGGVATCTYTINSATAGVFNVDATTTVDFSWGSFTQSVTRSTTGYAGPNGNQGATKTYVDARVSLGPDGVNAVGDPHTITGHAEYNDGTGWKDAAGKTITFTLSNEGGATATFVGGNSTCVTGTNGQCTVQIVSSTPGVSYVSASTSYAVLGVTLNRTSATDVHDPANVRKEWVAAHISITPNGVNEVRNTHTFTINVDAESSGAAISIGTIGATVAPEPGSKTLSCGDQTSTATGATKSCTLVINSNDPGVFTANASVTVTIGGVTFNLATNGQNGNSGPATKTYVDARVSVTPDGVNEVNHPHPVTAFVEINDGTHGWVPAGAGVVVGLTESGPGSIAASCTTAANGKCTTNLTSSAAGVSTVHASATVTVLGQTFTRETSTALNTYAGGGNDLTKRWVDAVISITPSAVNPVGAPHQFTITVVAIPSGAGTPTFAITPSVTPTPDSLLSGCATPTISADGNTATCTVTITDYQTGLFTANATATISVGGVTMTRSTDPASIYGHGPGGSGPATKQYVNANLEITPDGINEVGQPHTVTGHVTVDTGSGLVNAPDGTVIQLTIAGGPGSLSAPSCTTSGGTGSCSVTLTSPSVGTTSVHATSTVTVSGVTFNLETNGAAGTNSDNLRKDWVDGYVKVTPNGVNEVNNAHVFNVEYGVLAPAGTTVTLNSLTADVVPNPNTLESSTCGSPVRTGNVWTCTVTVNSSVTGVFDADAVGSATVTDPLIPGVSRIVTRSTTGTSGPGGNAGATKTYVDARISLAPGGLNEVDHPHAITATVETKDGNGAWTPAPAGTSVAFNLSGAGGFVGGISQCTTLGATGQCELSIVSGSAGVSTVGATSTVTVHGVSITRQTSTAVNTAAGGSGDVVKHWVDGSISVVQSAYNEVNHAHVFTITAQAHVASADETVVFNSITPSVSPTPDLATSTTCGSPTVAANGLSATCTYTVNSTTAGVFDADATVVMTIDNATYPAVQLTRSTAPGGDPGPSGNTGATKTFVDARVSVGPDGINAVGDPHTVTGTAEYNDGTGWKPAVGQTLTFAITSGPGSLSATTCQAAANGTCSVTLTSSQTGVTWVSASTGYDVQGVTLNRTTAVTGATDPNNLRKEWVDAAITITPSAVNEVGNAHVFDINVTASSSGATITIGTVGYTLNPTPDAAALSCGAQQGTTGTATKSCTLTINNNTAGVFTANATAPVDIDGVHFDLATDGTGGGGPAVKTYVDARLSLSPDGVNEVGNPHNVTALVEVNDGTHGWQPAPAGATVNLTETGPGSIPATCTIGAAGTCTVQLTSTTAGVSTVHGSVTLSVLGEPITRETSTAINTAAGGSGDLTKRWVDGFVTITPNGVNAVGSPHTFTVTATGIPSGAGAPSFVITPAVTPTPTSSSSTCGTPTVVGNTATCTVTINSDVPTVFTANVTAAITMGPVTVTRSTSGNAGPGGSGPATKTYVDARISITPGGLNEVDHPHTITATVETKDGNGAWTPAPAGTPVTFDLTGAGAFVGGTNTCTTTGVAGQCAVAITSSNAGVSTVGAATTVAVHGVSITRQTDTAVNTAAGGSGDVVKHWVDGSIRLVESAFNEVNHAHVFTITAQAHVASADETVVFDSITPSVSPTPDLATSTTCGSPTVAADGLSATCTYTVNSTTAGVFDADATVVMTIDNATYPAVQLTRSTGPAPGADPGPDGNTGATKTFVDARVSVGLDGVNAVGDPHTVTGTAQYNDGTGWKPAAGKTITFAITSGPGSLSATSCTANAAGTCSVTLTSNETGVTWVSASTSYAVDGVTLNRTTAVTGATDPNNLRKEWVGAGITITPSAVNEVNHAHVFDIVVAAESSGAEITIGDVAYTVTPKPDSAALACGTQTTTATGANKKCTLTINDSTPGVFTANATAAVDIGGVHFDLATDGVAPNSGPAVKTYVDARLSLSPNGINEVGNPHTVTALVEVNDGTHGWQPAPAGVTVHLTENGPGDIPASCTTGAAGTCTAQLTSTTAGVSIVHGSVTVGVLGEQITRETGTAINTAAGGSGDLTKRWIDGSITIGPSAQNNINDPHVFTITVTAVPSGGAPLTFDSITTSVTPTPTSMSNTCATPAIDGNTATCTMTINSSVEATYTANATAKISVGGTTIIRSTDSTVATAGPDGSGPATKVYIAPTVVLGRVLTRTGFELAPWIALASGLLVMGGAMLLATRKRRTSGS